MFLCAPPFIRSFGTPAGGPYEINVTIGSYAGYYFGYVNDDGSTMGSIDQYGEIFRYIYAANANNSWIIGIHPDSPVLPAVGPSYHFDTYIISGASSTGVYLPDGTNGIDYLYGSYIEGKATTIDINTSGTLSLTIEFIPA